MKIAPLLLAGLAAAAPELDKRARGVQGFDISHYQPNVDFKGAYNSGARFVIIKVCLSLSLSPCLLSSSHLC